jgi:hypothetical protein
MTLAMPFGSRSKSAQTSDARLSGVGVALIAIAIFALSVFSPRVLGDGDTWSHLATGQWILAQGDVPRVDPFSYTMQGAPWTAHEWLAEVLMALVFQAAGWPGLVILTGAAASATVLIMGLRAARDLSGLPLFIATGVGVGLLTAGLLARPHMLALPVLAAWGAGLMGARDRGRAPSLALAALMTLWSNLHGGFAFGLALIAPFALDAIVEAKPEARAAAARDWTLFAVASIAAAVVNPFGVDALLFPFRLLNVANLAGVSEWAPADFSRVSPLEIALLLLLGVALTRPLRLPLVPALLLIALVHLSLQHGRHEMLLGVLGPMLLARPLAKAMPAESPDGARSQVTRSMITVAAIGRAAR